MHTGLCVRGFEDSYDRVAAFAQQWKADQLDKVNSASKGTSSHQFFIDVAAGLDIEDRIVTRLCNEYR